MQENEMRKKWYEMVIRKHMIEQKTSNEIKTVGGRMKD
jgi:hypothetical protein